MKEFEFSEIKEKEELRMKFSEVERESNNTDSQKTKKITKNSLIERVFETFQLIPEFFTTKNEWNELNSGTKKELIKRYKLRISKK